MSIRGEFKSDLRKEPEELEHEADEAREALEHTLEEFEHRLSPRRQMDKIVHAIASNGSEFGHRLGTQVRDNPVPTILTGVALAWLITGTREPYQPGTGSRHADDGGMGESARERAAAAASGIGSAARGGAHSIGSTARRLSHGYAYLRDEQPLALGAVAVAAGALIAAFLPPTRTEARIAGDARERAAQKLDEQGERMVEAAEAGMARAADAAVGAPRSERETHRPSPSAGA